MAFPVFTLTACVLVIILVITATLAIIYFIRRRDCATYISPWCLPYSCAGNTTYNPTEAFKQVIANCKPVNGQPSPLCVCLWQNFYAPTSGINTCVPT